MFLHTHIFQISSLSNLREGKAKKKHSSILNLQQSEQLFLNQNNLPRLQRKRAENSTVKLETLTTECLNGNKTIRHSRQNFCLLVQILWLLLWLFDEYTQTDSGSMWKCICPLTPHYLCCNMATPTDVWRWAVTHLLGETTTTTTTMKKNICFFMNISTLLSSSRNF